MENVERKYQPVEQFADYAPEPTRSSRVIFFLLCATLVFSIVAYGAVDVWALGILSLIAGVIAVLWLGEAFFKKEFYYNPSFLPVPLLGLIVIGLVQLLPVRSDVADGLLGAPPVASLSLNPYATRLFIVQLIVYLVFFVAALTFVNNQKRLKNIVLLSIIFGAAMAFFGILQRLASPEALIYGLRPTPHAIPFASFVNQHHFAAFMNMTLGLTLGILFGKAAKKDKNLLLLIAAFLMGIALILTGSRGALISFVGVLGFLVAPYFLNKNDSAKTGENTGNQSRSFILIAALALIVGLFGAVFLLGEDQSLVRGVGLQGGQADLTNGRIHFWTIALKIFFDYPILGAGLNAFGVAFTRYDAWNGVFRVEQAHNDYLQTLADAGIVGFVCIAAFIYLLFKNALAVMKSSPSVYRRSVAHGALAGCFGILVHSLFDFPLRTPSNAFFFLTLATIATVSIYYPKTEKTRSER
jgi:O-antigen ligase